MTVATSADLSDWRALLWIREIERFSPNVGEILVIAETGVKTSPTAVVIAEGSLLQFRARKNANNKQEIYSELVNLPLCRVDDVVQQGSVITVRGARKTTIGLNTVGDATMIREGFQQAKIDHQKDCWPELCGVGPVEEAQIAALARSEPQVITEKASQAWNSLGSVAKILGVVAILAVAIGGFLAYQQSSSDSAAKEERAQLQKSYDGISAAQASPRAAETQASSSAAAAPSPTARTTTPSTRSDDAALVDFLALSGVRLDQRTAKELAESICGMRKSGMSMTELVSITYMADSGFTNDQLAVIIAGSLEYKCPQYK